MPSCWTWPSPRCERGWCERDRRAPVGALAGASGRGRLDLLAGLWVERGATGWTGGSRPAAAHRCRCRRRGGKVSRGAWDVSTFLEARNSSKAWREAGSESSELSVADIHFFGSAAKGSLAWKSSTSMARGQSIAVALEENCCGWKTWWTTAIKWGGAEGRGRGRQERNAKGAHQRGRREGEASRRQARVQQEKLGQGERVQGGHVCRAMMRVCMRRQ